LTSLSCFHFLLYPLCFFLLHFLIIPSQLPLCSIVLLHLFIFACGNF
jgi:hypothetical protein